MQLPKENSQLFLPPERCQRLFIQTWYSRVHTASLDTHRMRSMDSLAIADEILGSLGNTNVPLYRTKASCEEALLLLSQDQVLRDDWKPQTDRVLSALTTALKSKDEDTTCPDYLSLAYHLRRLKSEATAGYRDRLVHTIEDALAVGDWDAIHDTTGRLLTRLVNEGYSLEGLFGLVANVLIRRTRSVDFPRSLAAVKNKVLAVESEHEIIMRLTGPSKPLPGSIGSINFSQEPFGVSVGASDSAFFQRGQRTYYARIVVDAREERSAGEAARNRIERVMDALRFELVHDPISVHDEFICIPQDRPATVYRLPSTIPNPKKNIRPTEFADFLKRLSDLDSSDRFSMETKSKMQSALRYYRMSLDTPQLQNRLINSWTALEYLARERTQRSIIDGVRSNVTPLLVIPYLRVVLADFRETLGFTGAQMPAAVADNHGVPRYRDLELGQLLEVMRGPHFIQVQASCSAYPALQVALFRFQQSVRTSKKTATYIKTHKQNVEWHLTRLYGARNDIVHSADISTRLTLLCANLEYYVKLCIQEILEVAAAYQDIKSLEEIFAIQRQAMAFLLSDLEGGRDDVLKASLAGPIC